MRALRLLREGLARSRMRVAIPIAAAYHRRFVGEPDLQRVPIVINNFNRLECLQAQLAWLQRAGHTNIVILDNASTYPPLLEFYKSTPYEVVKLGRNVGYTALWDTPVWKRFRNQYYVYTDPDVIPTETCPTDAIAHFYRTLQAHPERGKVGFGLRIDDLPEHYALRDRVVTWESQFWNRPVASGLFDAPIDTTFALYRPRAEGGDWCRALRTGEPYVARHFPWYANSSHPSEEDQWYVAAAQRNTHWNHTA